MNSTSVYNNHHRLCTIPRDGHTGVAARSAPEFTSTGKLGCPCLCTSVKIPGAIFLYVLKHGQCNARAPQVRQHVGHTSSGSDMFFGANT